MLQRNLRNSFPSGEEALQLRAKLRDALTEEGDRLFRYAFRRLGDRDRAEDIVQDTFVAALRSISDFEERSSISTWLHSILKNKVFDELRKRTRGLNSLMVDQDSYSWFEQDGHWTETMTPQAWDNSPERSLYQKQLGALLSSCLHELSKVAHAVFCLTELDGMGSEEICNTLGLSSSNLRVVLFRARTQLRKCVEQGLLGSYESSQTSTK